jgi:hypothetical protein
LAATLFGSSIGLVNEDIINSMNRVLITIITLVLTQTAFGGDDYYYQCSKDERFKTIAVTYNSRSSDVPCSVTYTKKDQAVELWHADKQAGYCESKASVFAENQTGKGWNCTKNMGKKPK